MRWLREARVGDTMRYHTGYLARDRTRWTGERELQPVEPLNSVATLMYAAYEEDYVVLFQRKLEDGLYQYFVQKIRKVPDDYGKPKRKSDRRVGA